MDFRTGRADHIEDYLITVRNGQWFGWSNAQMDLLHYKLLGI